ncbi:MAG: methyltransferase domain-containing protein, partial [Rubrivivax sp.]
MPPGQALSLAEGEGRNAVHLARLGHRVTAVDFSAVGRDKARALAHRHGVDLDYELLDLKDLELGIDRWDLIVAVFSQPPAPVRQRLHGQLAQALRPGGHFVLESKVDADHGPLGRYPGVRHLRAEVTGLEVLHCEEADRELSEGHFHVGLHRTARIVARRPALPKSSDGLSGGTGGGTLRGALLYLALALTLAAGPESARATPNAPPAGITWMPIAGASSGPAAFEIARTETTVAQFRRLVQATGTVTRAERAGGGQVYEAGWTAKPGWTWARPFGV